jgi:CheY-like chemotaxis protein
MPTIEKSLRVLVVDDSRDVADAIGLLVEALGSHVSVTYDGKKALEVANSFRPDLMLIDLLMPGIGGCELVTRFREIPIFSRTRMVAITGQIVEEQESSAIKAGFDAVLIKPLGLKKLMAVLARGGKSP